MKRMDGLGCRLSVVGCRGKQAQQMTLGTIIAIVLGIAVLVFLIFGFSQGWNALWEKVTAFGGGDANVDTIVQACALKCSVGDKYGFCEQTRTVKFGEDVAVGEDCAAAIGDETASSCSSNCQDLVDDSIARISVAPCSGLC